MLDVSLRGNYYLCVAISESGGEVGQEGSTEDWKSTALKVGSVATTDTIVLGASNTAEEVSLSLTNTN